MNLQQYPEAIAQAAYLVNILNTQITEIRGAIGKIEGQASASVSLNEALKEEHQRKAVRFNILQSSQEYQELQQKLAQAIESRANAQADLDKLVNEFGVAKINAKAASGRRSLTWPMAMSFSVVAISFLTFLLILSIVGGKVAAPQIGLL